MARRTVLLKGDLGWRYEEAYASVAIYPGNLGMRDSNGKIQPHNVRGGRAEKLFPVEDALQGKLISTQYAIGDLVRYIIVPPGSSVQAILKKLENVVIGDKLISNGDGTLVKAASAVLANAVASSTAVTAAVETTFSNGTVTIPKNTLQIGDRIRIRARGTIGTATGSETTNIKVKIGANILFSTGVVDPVSGDIFFLDGMATIRTIGASGTFVSSGLTYLGTSASAAGAQDVPSASFLGSTAIDTTADNTITVTCTNSSTGESVTLDELLVEVVRGTTNALDATGGAIIAEVNEAVDLSAASADGLVPCRIL